MNAGSCQWVGQYVLLGAGLDSYAFRRPELVAQLVLFEIDHPATRAADDSSVVFDYLDEGAFVPGKCALRAQRMLSHVASLGEPMQTGFDPLTLAEELAPLGLELTENLSPGDINSRWFLGRTGHYRACAHAHFCPGAGGGG